MDPAELLEQSIFTRHQDLMAATANQSSDTQMYYSNTNLFITGGTGFLGKQLIEKLLRSCKIRKIFLLIRPKKEKSVEQRLQEMLKDPVFDLVRKSQPDFQNSIVSIEGDVSLLGLGISDENWNTVTEEVAVIFHCAATLKFDEPLQTATITNVRGAREMINLARACKHLRSYVHVSTAFSHATLSKVNKEVLEDFYSLPIPPDTAIQLAEDMDIKTLDDIAESLLRDWPNTYCFTKALAEELVRIKAADLPVCIVRPAIIVGAYNEPEPGWIDPCNLYGASGLLLGYITGIIHVNFSTPSGKMDFVPVDLVNNAIICAGKETGKRFDGGEREIKIYTMTSERNGLSPEECTRILHKDFRKYMSPKAIWYMHLFVVDTALKYIVYRFLFHIIPATVVDIARRYMGKKPKLTPIYKKVDKMTALLKYFSLNIWTFSDTNLMEIYKNMSDVDKIIFNFDMGNISKRDMLVIWSLGLRKYVLKDKLQGTSDGVRKQKYFKILSLAILLIYVFIIWLIIQLLYFVMMELTNK